MNTLTTVLLTVLATVGAMTLVEYVAVGRLIRKCIRALAISEARQMHEALDAYMNRACDQFWRDIQTHLEDPNDPIVRRFMEQVAQAEKHGVAAWSRLISLEEALGMVYDQSGDGKPFHSTRG